MLTSAFSVLEISASGMNVEYENDDLILRMLPLVCLRLFFPNCFQFIQQIFC